MATIPAPVAAFSPEQRALWRRVVELWELSKGKDPESIRSTLHPDYVGWDMNAPLPHDRDAAVRSVSGATPELRAYELHPLSVQVYGGTVGVVHYAYAATVLPTGAAPVNVSGKWSEVYLRQGETWTLVSVSGRPDSSPPAA